LSRLFSRLLSPVPSQLSTRARGTNDKPTHLSIAPNAVRTIPFHYIIVITDGTVGAGFKPARIIAAPVATRTIAAFAIGSFVCQASCPHLDTAIMQLALAIPPTPPDRPVHSMRGGFLRWELPGDAPNGMRWIAKESWRKTYGTSDCTKIREQILTKNPQNA